MNRHVQIKNVKPSIHKRLKEVAASKGMSMSDYVTRLIENDLAHKPTWDEWVARVQSRPPVHLKETGAEAVRAIRDELDRS